MRNKASISAAAPLPLRRAERAQTVSDVLFGGQVREERQVLMHVPRLRFQAATFRFFPES